MGAVVWPRRIRETLAIITIGDGIVALIAPREHSLLWELGPPRARRVARFFADNPNHMRLLGLVQVGFGVWLALRQYEEG